jgi:carboxyl-terminal processing protease
VLAALLVFALLLEACAGAGGGRGNLGSPRVSGGSPGGDGGAPREAAGKPAPSAAKPAPAQGQGGEASAAPGGADGTLSSSDLGQVYRFILDRYVDRVDHVALVQAASTAVREAELKAGALPLDTAPLDFAPAPAGNPDRDWQNFARAYDAVLQKHPKWAAASRPDWAALRQMLASLGDGSTLFVEPEELRRMNESSYSGVGVRMSKPQPEEPPVIMEVFQNSPAGRAGLKAGDRVTAVDGKPTEGKSLTEVIAGVRGPQGTPVTLSVSRGGQSPLDTRVTREPVEAPRVEGSVRGNVIGILRIRSFGEGVPEMVQQVLTQGRQRGARAWVLDLRGNSGGALNAVARVAANFVDNRPVGLAVDRSGNREPINAEGRASIPRTPLVVLVDRETAAGAEILAAAMREHQIGPIVGTTTAGSGGIAFSRQLSDGSAVQITVRRLLTPSGAPIDKVGVQPDVPTELTVADLERGEDPQLMRAFELLLGRGP